MRVSSKGRYGMVAMLCLAQNYAGGEPTTILSVSARGGISKIYLEQVFTLLRRGGLVQSVKGAQGGYLLARHPEKITAYQILQALEPALFDKTEGAGSAQDLTAALTAVWDRLDESIKALEEISLAQLANEASRFQQNSYLMSYI